MLFFLPKRSKKIILLFFLLNFRIKTKKISHKNFPTLIPVISKKDYADMLKNLKFNATRHKKMLIFMLRERLLLKLLQIFGKKCPKSLFYFFNRSEFLFNIRDWTFSKQTENSIVLRIKFYLPVCYLVFFRPFRFFSFSFCW